MKKISIILLFAVALPFVGSAQTKDNYPYWTISKDVQRIQYKNVELLPAKITTGNTAWNISKGVAQATASKDANVGKVTTSGYPTWTISKGVARMNAEK